MLACTAYTKNIPTVESKGAFLKIVDADRAPGAPIDRDAPNVLYIRREAIVRVSVIYATRSSEYQVIVVTNSPLMGTRFDEVKLTVTSDAKVYFYTLPNEAAATAFCDALTS